MKTRTLFSAAAFLVAAPAIAQDSTASAPAQPLIQASASAAPQCELHIWPAERFQAMTTGWGVGFGALGALADSAGHAKGDKARRSQLASALDSEGQLDALQKLDLIALLRLQPAKIVTHAEALDRKTVNKVLARRSDSTAPCYSELIVTDVFYQKAAMWGRSLRTSFILRDFPTNANAPSIRKTTGGNGLSIFPAKEGEDATAADAELVSVFQRNFTEAAQNFARQAKGS